jgi:hypothetical protein
MPRFDPEAILRALEAHRVNYVLIGGLAATLHGSPIRTGDANICPSPETDNLERLAAALADIIRSKEAADRSKDRLTLPTLRTLLRKMISPDSDS